jgi:alpha-ribazole phosphatase
VRLILVRHGETNWNAQSRYQGQANVPLNDLGQQQAAALAHRLARHEVTAVHASDLLRARQTAQVIALPHRLPVQEEPRLREMSFGDWEGLTYAEIQERDAGRMADWFADPVCVAPPGGETLDQVAGRARSALDAIVETDIDQTVVLVSHGGLLRVLICLSLGIDIRHHWRFRLDVASLSEIALYEGAAVLTYLNDRHHLKDLGEDRWES